MQFGEYFSCNVDVKVDSSYLAVSHSNSDIYLYDVCTAQCDAGTGTNALFQQLYRKPPKLLVLGGGCSEVSEATAQVSHLWNLVQVCGARLKHIPRPFIYGAYYGIVLFVCPSVRLSVRSNP